MKLTAQIAMAYPSAYITTKYDEGKSHKVVGVSEWEGNLQVQTSENDTDWWNIDQCQLLLSPLSEISEEDAIEVAKMADLPQSYRSERYAHNDRDNMSLIGREIAQDIVNDFGDPTIVSPINERKIVDHLRSKCYDCGHGSIPSLIEAGIAVKK